MSTNLDKQLALVRDGRIGYADFTRATRSDFGRLAASLIRRWRPPEWLGEDDVVQEMHVAAWPRIWKWDPDRGPSLSRYVVFGAMDAAKYAVHVARGAMLHGSRDCNPSRNLECPLSSFEVEQGDSVRLRGDVEAAMVDDGPTVEAMLMFAEDRRTATTEAIEVCATTEEEIVVRAIIDYGDVDMAAADIYETVGLRSGLNLKSTIGARRRVLEVGRVVAERLARTF